MERFTVKINKVYKAEDGKMMLVFDVYTNGVKVGEAESEYSVFQGVMIGKVSEYASSLHLNALSAAVAPQA